MQNSIKLIEEYKHTGKGYNPYLIGARWQVAQLNFEPNLAPDKINKIDIHYNTDETFLLMAGQAVLIAAEITDSRVEFEVINLKHRVLYNIPRGCWHNIALSTDAEVFIVEDANTHLNDFEFYYLTQADQRELVVLIESVWQNK